MIIDRVETINFKSYYGVQVIGPFSQHFSCIIGPNGNGKSNIIDALLFVFGFRSIKLRQDKLQNLIHYSSSHPKCDFSKVTIIFKEKTIQKNNQIMTIKKVYNLSQKKQQRKQLAEIKVSRTVSKSGTSFYCLNDQKINWNQLRTHLLETLNIDLQKNLFIILQGQVQKLCQLNAMSLLDHLQYISGSDKYLQDIEESEKKYVQNGVQRDRAYTILNLKKRVYENSLKKARQMIDFFIQQLRISQIQALVSKKELQNKQKKMLKIKDQQLILKQKYQKMQQEQKIKQQKLKILQSQKIILKKEEKILQNQEINVIINKKEKLKTEFNNVLSIIDSDKLLLKRKQKQLQKYQKDIQQIKKLKKDKQNIQNLQGIILKNKDNLHQILIISTQAQQKLKKLNIINDQELNKNQLLQKLKLQLVQKQKKLYQMNEQMQKIINIGKQINAVELKFEYRKLVQDQQSSLRKQISQLASSIEIVDNKLKAYQNQNKQFQVNRVDRVITQLMIAQQLNLLIGLEGTLRKFVIFQQQYEGILSIVLPQLDFMIVDTVQNAAKASNFLRQKKAGRMTFLIKSHIISLNVNEKAPFKCPNKTVRVFDLLKVINNDQSISKILFWCLANTLLTDNIENAIKIAFQDDKNRKRVITSKGQLVQISGTITAYEKRKTAKESQEQLKIKLETFLSKKKSLDEKLFSLQNRKNQILSLIQKKQEVQKNGKLQSLKQDIQDQQTKIKQIKEKVLSLQKIQLKKIQNQKNELIKDINLFIKYNGNNKSIKQQKLTFALKIIKQNQQIQEKLRKLQASAQIIKTLNKKRGQKEAQLQALKEKIKKSENQAQKINQLIEVENQNLLKKEKKLYQIHQKIGFIQQKQFMQSIQIDSRKQSSQIKQKITNNLQKQRNIQIQIQQSKCKFLSKKEKTQYLNNFKKQYINDLLAEQAFDIDINDMLTLMIQGQKQLKYQDFNEDLFQSIDISHFISCCDIAKQGMNKFYRKNKLDKQKDQFSLNTDYFQQYNVAKQDLKQKQTFFKQIDCIQNKLRQDLLKLRRQRSDVFINAFTKINIQLKTIYHKLTNGQAELVLVNCMNPFQGVQFTVKPAHKGWKNVNLLSGGQKTLTSLSLIFACQQVKKFPFYFMDEIDAALDYRNTTLLGNYIKSKVYTQHIVISLRRNMYEQCDSLIGVYKVKDESKVIQVKRSFLQEISNIKCCQSQSQKEYLDQKTK